MSLCLNTELLNNCLRRVPPPPQQQQYLFFAWRWLPPPWYVLRAPPLRAVTAIALFWVGEMPRRSTGPTTRVPQAVGWCRGGNRNWVGGIPLFEKQKSIWFNVHLIGNCQLSVSCCFDRYWSHIQISRNDEMDLEDFTARVFSTSFDVFDFQEFELSKNNMVLEGVGIFLELFWVIWWVQS